MENIKICCMRGCVGLVKLLYVLDLMGVYFYFKIKEYSEKVCFFIGRG